MQKVNNCIIAAITLAFRIHKIITMFWAQVFFFSSDILYSMFSTCREKISRASGCLLCCSNTISSLFNPKTLCPKSLAWKNLFSQDMMKSIDPIQPVSLSVFVNSTYWMSAYTCTYTHTVCKPFFWHSRCTCKSTRLQQPNTTGRPSLKIDMMAIKGGLVNIIQWII